MLLKASDLRMLDVINVSDGRRLGNIYDLDVDLEAGRIRSLILPGGGGGWFASFTRQPEIEISWERVVKIGVDVILVDIPERSESSYYPR